jgi:hypothetical protein
MAQSRSVFHARQCNGKGPTGTEVRARMKVLIGVDAHEAPVAVAAVDELGELIECASFPQNRAGLRAFEDAGRNGLASVVGR